MRMNQAVTCWGCQGHWRPCTRRHFRWDSSILTVLKSSDMIAYQTHEIKSWLQISMWCSSVFLFKIHFRFHEYLHYCNGSKTGYASSQIDYRKQPAKCAAMCQRKYAAGAIVEFLLPYRFLRCKGSSQRFQWKLDFDQTAKPDQTLTRSVGVNI